MPYLTSLRIRLLSYHTTEQKTYFLAQKTYKMSDTEYCKMCGLLNRPKLAVKSRRNDYGIYHYSLTNVPHRDYSFE
jgi:hypothetical protein